MRPTAAALHAAVQTDGAASAVGVQLEGLLWALRAATSCLHCEYGTYRGCSGGGCGGGGRILAGIAAEEAVGGPVEDLEVVSVYVADELTVGLVRCCELLELAALPPPLPPPQSPISYSQDPVVLEPASAALMAACSSGAVVGSRNGGGLDPHLPQHQQHRQQVQQDDRQRQHNEEGGEEDEKPPGAAAAAEGYQENLVAGPPAAAMTWQLQVDKHMEALRVMKEASRALTSYRKVRGMIVQHMTLD